MGIQNFSFPWQAAVLGLIQPPVRIVSGVLFLGSKTAGDGADYSCLHSEKVVNVQNFISTTSLYQY
jgi:hypothetical protein